MSSATLDRVGRVVSLDASVFGEVAADTQATGTAILLVMAVAASQALAMGGGAPGWLVGVADASLRWLLWVVSIHVLARTLALHSELGALVRALGFASTPLALGALAGLPWIGGFFWVAKWALALAAFVLAVRRVLAVETGHAIGLAAGGLAVAMLLAIPMSWIYPG
jgi:hypothetical protein